MLGDETLRLIARELADTVRRNATIDWTVKESARANLRRLVRRILARYGYPPDKQEQATLTVLEQAELLGLEVAAEPVVLPFRHLDDAEAQPLVNCIPLYSLAAAAGSFSEAHTPKAEAWVAHAGRVRPEPGLFVAQVVGESMNRRIPNGAFCVFRSPVEGSRTGRVLLVEHRDISDADHGGAYTVKLYERAYSDEVLPRPDTDSDRYAPISLHGAGGDVRVVAELVEVLPG